MNLEPGVAVESARPLPLALEEIDADWLTRALRVNFPGVTIRDVGVDGIIRGTCTKIRLRLDMDEAGRDAGIPETVFLKGGFEEHSPQMTFLAKTESLGYRDLLSSSGLNSPACYFADFDEASNQGIIVMEDLARRGVTFGDPMVPRSHDDIAATLSLLAGFHAKTWGCGEFGGTGPLGWIETAPPFSRPGVRRYLEPDAWQHYCGLPRGAAASSRFHDRGWAIDALDRIARYSQRLPKSVIHGDTHLGNVCFEPDGTPAFYDIVPRRAPPMSEVCYHITLALDVADRGNWEVSLVRHYLSELKHHGVTDPPDMDEAMLQYGAFLVEGYCLVLTNDAYFLAEAPITAYAARFSAAMLENDTAGRIASLA